MKTFLIFFSPALMVCLTLPVQAQPGAPGVPASFDRPVRASEVIGAPLKNLRDQKLGMIKDLALDLDNGRILEVVVARGGFLGVDEKLVAVPPDNFRVEEDGKTLRLDLDKEKLDGAPPVDLSKWSETMKPARVEEVYQYYGARPYFLAPDGSPKNADHAVAHLMEVERASQLLHLPVLNYVHENFGKVEDFIVDLPAGRVMEVVIASGVFLHSKDELSAVPPQALDFNSDRNLLMLDTTAEALAGAPPFPARSWPRIDREQIGQVYRAYQVTPYFLAAGPDGVTPNAEAATPTDSIVTSLDAVENKADFNITSNIRREIQKAGGLSDDARNVKINTVHGRVTLSGTVVDGVEKRRLGRLAARYGAGGSVDNQLVIKPAATSASN